MTENEWKSLIFYQKHFLQHRLWAFLLSYDDIRCRIGSSFVTKKNNQTIDLNWVKGGYLNSILSIKLEDVTVQSAKDLTVVEDLVIFDWFTPSKWFEGFFFALVKIVFLETEEHSETCQTTNMERIAKIVNGF